VSGPSIVLDAQTHLHELFAAIDGQAANLRAVLRSVEAGTFVEQAQAPGARTIVHFSVANPASAADGAPSRASANAFRGMLSAFITFLDRLIAVQRLMQQGTLRVTRDLKGPEDILQFAREQIDNTFVAVARDTSLTNPKKVAELSLSPEAVEITGALFAVRRCIEHRGSVPEADLELKYRTVVVLAEDREITAMPAELKEGEALRMLIPVRSKTFPAGVKLALSEAEIDNVGLTLRLLAQEALEIFNKRFPRPAWLGPASGSTEPK
jgi:hypothetical protein